MKDNRQYRDSAKACYWSMIVIILILFVLIAMCGCKTKNVPAETLRIRTDSVRTEVRYERIFIKDTVYLEVPAQMAELTTKDSMSFLENDFSRSYARINADGSLFHDLKTKPQKRPVPVDKEIERKDSIVYVDKKIEVPVPVERKLTSWEKICLKYFPYSVVVLLLALVYIFRKKIISFIMRFI